MANDVKFVINFFILLKYNFIKFNFYLFISL